jgi:hypothetical protein
MGIFDIFTGDTAKKAAEENKKLLQENLATGTKELKEGRAGAIGALDTAAGYYAPLASKYGKATTLGLDALSVNGPEGNARAVEAFRASPGYDYRVDQTLDGVARKANALGVSMGGNTLAELSDRAGHMADQEYGAWVDRLNGYVSPELAATGGEAAATMAKAPVYTTTATNLAGLGTTTTNGITKQNTEAANAEMQGSSNLWGLGLNLAKMGLSAATGGVGGGGSLLGGGGGSGSAMGTMQVGNQLFPAFG